MLVGRTVLTDCFKGNAVPGDLSEWIPPKKYDIYAIGTQECSYTDESSVKLLSKDDWFRRVACQVENLDFQKDPQLKEYEILEQESLMEMKLIVLIRKDLRRFVQKVKKETEATGLAHIVGNKGGVGRFYNTT
jgi:hypothetical protein